MPDQTPPEAEILFRSGATVTPEAQLWIRNRIGISTIQAVGDANTTITAGTTTVRLSASLTAARIYTLPNPASYAVGETLVFTDTIGSLTTANTVTLSAGAGTVNGVATIVLTTPYASPILISNGVDKWTLNTPVTRATLSLATTDAPAFSGLTVNGPINTNTVNSIGWTNSTRMAASTDGNLYIYSGTTAGSPFSSIHIGSTNTTASPAFKFGFSGTTVALRATNDTVDANLTCGNITTNGLHYFGAAAAGFPMLKRSGSTLLVRLADDSDAGDFQARGGQFTAVTSTGVMNVGTNNSFGWTNATRMTGQVDGNLNIHCTAASPFSAIHIGSTGSAASPAFKFGFSGTTIALRATNDTVDANLTCGDITSSGASAASAPAVRLTGAVFNTGGTGMTTTPHLLIEPAGTPAVTAWNTAGTQLGINAASGYTGNFLDFHTNGGSSLFSVTSAGVVFAAASIVSNINIRAGANSRLEITGRGGLGASADGVFQLGGNANTANGSLSCGSITANTLVQAGLAAPLSAAGISSMTSTGKAWTLIGGTSVIDGAEKQTRIGGLHCAAGEEPVIGMYVLATDTTNAVLIGGGTALGNAATAIEFYTAANNTTTFGSARWLINSAGHFLSSADNFHDIGASGPSGRVRSVFAATSVVVENGGFVAAASTGSLRIASRAHLSSSADGLLCLTNGTAPFTDFNRLQFGGTTSSFPAIKRNGAGIDIKLADDISGFAAVQSLYQRFGTGTPEAVVTAPVGAVYHRTDGGAGTSFYVKESGAGNTGWVAK